MQTIELEGGSVRITGALDFDRSATGISPRRLPAWTRSQITDLMTAAVVGLPSGVRLEFVTDAKEIELHVQTITTVFGDGPIPTAVFDLVVDDVLVEHLVAVGGNRLIVNPVNNAFSMQKSAPPVLRFKKLGPKLKRVALWLPANANVELRALRISNGASIAPAPAGERRRWIHHGSSISHCFEADAPTGTWPVVAARLASVDVMNLGFGGSCHLDQFTARTIRDLPADLISLKVGINVVNGETLKERTFGPALHGFLDTVRDGHPHTPLLVTSPIICPTAEDHPGPTVPDANGVFRVVERPAELMEGCLTLRRIREIIADTVEKRRALGDTNLHYLDGLRLFGEGDVGDLPDGLHPNTAGYQRMGERFQALAFGEGGAFAAAS